MCFLHRCLVIHSSEWAYKYVYICLLKLVSVFFSSLQEVEKQYEYGGWTRHHSQLLEYDETYARKNKPSMSLKVAEPEDDYEKNWEVVMISSFPVSYTFHPTFITIYHMVVTSS